MNLKVNDTTLSRTKLYLEALELWSFRNFKHKKLQVGKDPVVIFGLNGAGKTSILEAISMFSPGKGFRAPKLEEIVYHGATEFKVSAIMNTTIGKAEISTLYKEQNERRIIDFNGVKTPNTELTKLLSIIWLTPQMEMLFIGPSADRRKFLDRIVYNFDPEHASRIAKYEYLIKERMKILKMPSIDLEWVSIIENKIAESSVSIAFARCEAVKFLRQSIENFETSFPKADVTLKGEIEEKVLEMPALKLEEVVKEAFYNNRKIDLETNKTNFGPHKTDMMVFYNSKPVRLCSTGEQKAMLISLIIAEVYAKVAWNNSSPIVLLDEVLGHLDYGRKNELIEFLKYCNVQYWLTSPEIVEPEFTKHTQVIELNKT